MKQYLVDSCIMCPLHDELKCTHKDVVLEDGVYRPIGSLEFVVTSIPAWCKLEDI